MNHRIRILAAVAATVLSLHAASAQEAPAAPAAPTSPAAPAPYKPPSATAEAPAVAPAAPAPVPASVPAAPVDDAITAAVAALPTGIEDVQVVGPWVDGDKSGVWRTAMVQVGTAEKESYRFFVQQVEKAAGVSTVMTTTEIKEIPGINGAVVGYRADEPTEGDTAGLTLFFDVVPSDGEISETYELHFQKDRSYTFGPASN